MRSEQLRTGTERYARIPASRSPLGALPVRGTGVCIAPFPTGLYCTASNARKRNGPHVNQIAVSPLGLPSSRVPIVSPRAPYARRDGQGRLRRSSHPFTSGGCRDARVALQVPVRSGVSAR